MHKAVGLGGILAALSLIFIPHLATGSAVTGTDWGLAISTLAAYFGIPIVSPGASNPNAGNPNP